MVRVENPVIIFRNWFKAQPINQQQYLSRMYWLFTSENTADLILNGQEALKKFDYKLTEQDFPLRILSRAMFVRTMFDFIVKNRQVLERQIPRAGKVCPLSEKQWQKTRQSWLELRSSRLNDQVFDKWLEILARS